MGLISTILIGLVVGLIARAIMPGRDPMGLIMTTLLGIGGALIGKFIGKGLGFYKDQDPVGFFMSLLGAIILLLIYNMVRNKNAKV